MVCFLVGIWLFVWWVVFTRYSVVWMIAGDEYFMDVL